ncbi:hypothetical protein B4119_4030 [Parageobacillus caldoxylosilyticus]|uniref:Uncharacterized protein n=1 Tax=Saccharococcus caldoxylosilyticus TaxID=81408 RepID=A0A150M2C5_9BACL|nr:hypothetical protein B4119_4030 [Parageobacillus caldoxylosilyticus]
MNFTKKNSVYKAENMHIKRQNAYENLVLGIKKRFFTF